MPHWVRSLPWLPLLLPLLPTVVGAPSAQQPGVALLEVRLPVDGVVLPWGSPLAVDFVVKMAPPPAVRWQVCAGVFFDFDRAQAFSVRPQQDSLWCDDAGKWVNSSASAPLSHAPLEFTGVRPGTHVLWVLLQDAQSNVLVGEPQVVAFSVATADFEPTYAWQAVQPGQSIPGGLEVRMDLGGSGSKLARIPATWRVQVWLDEASRFLRSDVSAHTRVGKLADAAARLLGPVDPRCVLVVDTNVPTGHPPITLPPEGTVEDLRLFQRQRSLKIMRDARCAFTREHATAPASLRHPPAAATSPRTSSARLRASSGVTIVQRPPR